MLKKWVIVIFSLVFTSVAWSKAIIDQDVSAKVENKTIKRFQSIEKQTMLVFIHSIPEIDAFIHDMESMNGVSIKKFSSLPVVLVEMPAQSSLLETLANHPAVMQISSLEGGQEELELSEQAILLRPSASHPTVSNWWDNGFKGSASTIGLIDSGVAVEHPSLDQKKIIIRQEPGSGFSDFKNGVRSAHGTGVACIYAGQGSAVFPNDVGVAFAAFNIVAGFAGEGNGNIADLSQTLSTLDWMLHRSGMSPDVINYSFGNGLTNCANCTDWSGLAKVVDYVVNHDHILWVKSAGNGGYVNPNVAAPYASTMSRPADNYNALTVANINPNTGARSTHVIQPSSSRGPTLIGRKKPDIAAPGNNTRTCAPDPSVYPFKYTQSMDYHDGYRLMGGTSSATPHVGAAAALLHEAGLHSPMAKKALLINSADAYTDNNSENTQHHMVLRSEWNRTYGWGYLNMQKAYEQRHFIYEDSLTLDTPQKTYIVDLPVGGKVTLVHERRVGYTDNKEWALSHLSLELWDLNTHKPIARDDSAIDTIHQSSNNMKPTRILVKVKLLSSTLDGSMEEPYALAMSEKAQ